VTGKPASDFGDLLRGLRKDARLTQEELAEDAAVSLRTIQDLEGRRHRTAHKPTAEKLAGALKRCSPKYMTWKRTISRPPARNRSVMLLSIARLLSSVTRASTSRLKTEAEVVLFDSGGAEASRRRPGLVNLGAAANLPPDVDRTINHR